MEEERKMESFSHLFSLSAIKLAARLLGTFEPRRPLVTVSARSLLSYRKIVACEQSYPFAVFFTVSCVL